MSALKISGGRGDGQNGREEAGDPVTFLEGDPT
jgi:hypothetical protein